MGRYATAVGDTTFWLTIADRGWGVVVVPHTEQREIAEELARQVPGRPAIELGADAKPDWFHPIATAAATTPAGAFLYLSRDLDKAGRARVFSMLNQQRDRTSMFGVWVLVVSLAQHEEARRHAGDLVSVFSSFERVRFVPRTLTDDELVAARAELHAYYQRRFGRLDLRGFIRSEQEDVSFAVEDIFQPLTAVPILGAELGELALDDKYWRTFGGAPLIELLTEERDATLLVVGGPGAGKSFFARWCALAGSRDARFLDRDRAIPLYVPLAVTRIHAEMPALEAHIVDAFLEAELTIAHAIASEAAAGRAVFLLDGLDEVGAWRAPMVEAVGELARRYPQARFVVTSRPTGLDGLAFDARRFDLEGLHDDAIVALLTAWCELYESQRAGPDGRARGREEGTRLGGEVVGSPTMRELARVPLLATIIAIVHRAGVRLPDHRVELYEHIVRILVERWNQLRNRDADVGAVVIRAPDAIRLLGPVAYDMVANGRDGAIDEASLRSLIARQLKRGTIRGIADADEALDVFRNSLGLLVEQAPGIYSFLHKTLGEFLAAHEAVRTGALEKLLEPATCFEPQWREVILLALGIVGTVQANDDRLAVAVATLVNNAASRRAEPESESVGLLLGGVIADDPALSPALATQIADELVPAWWFDRGPRPVTDAVAALCERILRGPLRDEVASRLRQAFRGGLHVTNQLSVTNLGRLVVLLAEAGLCFAPLLCEHIAIWLAWGRAEVTLLTTPLRWLDPTVEPLSARGLIQFARPADGGDGQLLCRVLIAIRESERRQRMADLLEAWREIAATGAVGPQPPASVEEALAKYGPRTA